MIRGRLAACTAVEGQTGDFESVTDAMDRVCEQVGSAADGDAFVTAAGWGISLPAVYPCDK